MGRRLATLTLLALLVAVRRRRLAAPRRCTRRQPLPGRRHDRYLGANPVHAALATLVPHPLTPNPPHHAPLQAPLAAARRPLQTGTALGKPAGDQALVAQQQQQALEQQQQQQAQQQQQQQQQAEPVDQLEGEQPQVRLATTQQPTEQQPQQQQQPAAAATVQASQQPQQQAAQQQGVDEMFLCQDKLANATIVEQLPQLKIEQVLNSNKPRSPQDVTLVTQLSFERCVLAVGGLGRVGCWMARCIASGGLQHLPPARVGAPCCTAHRCAAPLPISPVQPVHAGGAVRRVERRHLRRRLHRAAQRQGGDGGAEQQPGPAPDRHGGGGGQVQAVPPAGGGQGCEGRLEGVPRR